MSLSRWFLPETPDVLGMLVAQAGISVEGMEALVRWAEGDADAADEVRDAEHRADATKRLLRAALRSSFLTPLDAEDIYAMSERLDAALNQAKDAVREAEVMAMVPGPAERAMAELVAHGTRHLADAFESLAAAERGPRSQPIPRPATECADLAIKDQRRLERAYRTAMSALVEVDDLREVMGRRELLRRLARIGDTLIEVGERIWYAAVKEG